MANEDEKPVTCLGVELRTLAEGGRFVLTTLNFGVTFVFVWILVSNAFTMTTITGKQVFLADRVLQSFTHTPPNEIDSFIKKVYGTETEVVKMIDNTVTLPHLLPTMYEISGSNSIMRLESVHCNFMLFSALWIASAFSLTMIQIPGKEHVYWDTLRVVIVHAWNLIGLIFTIVLFSATTKWGSIPTSNLFYALVGQVMAWMYQYFHMVECTQVHVASLELKFANSHDNSMSPEKTEQALKVDTEKKFSSELRKIVYMEFSVVVPMLLVAAMMPGSIGVDEWRVQTVLFSSWTLFALLGLHLRYRKTLHNLSGRQEGGLDALGYLMYAIVLVYIMLVNAIGTDGLTWNTFTTTRIIECRQAVILTVFVSGMLVVETLINTLKSRFWHNLNAEEHHHIIFSFASNVFVVVFGSFLVKILIFSGLSDVNALSTWYV